MNINLYSRATLALFDLIGKVDNNNNNVIRITIDEDLFVTRDARSMFQTIYSKRTPSRNAGRICENGG